MIKEIPAIKESISDYDEMERRIIASFRKYLYAPLMEALGQSPTLLNERDYLKEAIRSGKVQFAQGKFFGNFSSAVSKQLKGMGAKWAWNGQFHIRLDQLPVDLQEEIRISESRFVATLTRVDEAIAKILPAEIADKVKLQDLFDSTLWKTEKSLQQSVKNITVMPKLTESQADLISKEYSTNLKLYIKDFAEHEIIELRKKVQEQGFKGLRYENLTKTIQQSYGVTHRKAKFLARQETNLLMTKFKQARYTGAGVNEYKWGCVVGSKLHPVRKMHKALEGKTFRWDDPPVTSQNGARNNPGQDYNCRCYARPIVRF